MVGNHGTVIHFVDMVTRQYQHIVRLVSTDDVQILIHRIRGTRVPGVLYTLLCRQQLDEFLEFTTQEAPAMLDMLNQRVCLVLGQDTDHADTRIHAVRQREIDDAELPAKRDSRLGAPERQLT